LGYWGYISSNTSFFMSFVDAFVYRVHVVVLENGKSLFCEPRKSAEVEK
jgi:hypothetical protein